MKTLLFILFPFCLLAQTRFYITTQSVATPIGPVVIVNNIWTQINGADGTTMKSLTPYEGGVSIATILVSNINVPTYLLFRRCLTPPLATQTLNCTLSGQLAYRAFNGGHHGFIMLRLVNPNGSVAKEIDSVATTVGLSSSANYVNKTFTYSIVNLNITAGQRLLLEIGDSYQNTATGANAGINRGNLPTNADLPVDNTTINNSLNPWFQFSQTIKFMPLGINF